MTKVTVRARWIEFGDRQHSRSSLIQVERGGELRSIVPSAAFDLRELFGQFTLAGDVAGDGQALGNDAEAALSLPGGEHAIIGDELGHSVRSYTVISDRNTGYCV